jgi:predicted GNAT family acetyltransferase
MNLSPKHNPEEFRHFLFNEIDLDLYKHKFIRDLIIKAQSGLSSLYDKSLINITKEGWILIIHSEILLVYGHNWSIEQFDEIREIFDLNNFNNYTIAGEDELIEALIKFYNPINSHTEKRRVFYQTESVKVYEKSDFSIEKGALNQLDELAVMLQLYYHEEYNGLNDKELNDMQERIHAMLEDKTIYVLLNTDRKIISFCSIIDPDIGILYTKNEFRNNGYAKIILSYCANLLKQKNSKVFLMTDRDKPESNQVCNKVGFKPYFNYKMIKINCD